MAESTLTATQVAQASGGGGIWLKVVAIAWRNLWRNRRRTWLTAGGIAFAVFMLMLPRAFQDGMFAMMVDNGARMSPGHAQVQHPDYHESPQMENTLRVSGVIDNLLRTGDFEFVSERAQGFALISAGEKSFGAQVVGLRPEIESQWSMLATSASEGRYIERAGEAYIGTVLARNIGVRLNDEIVVLGTARQGGVAALALEVVGIFTSGIADLDRGILHVHIDDFRDAWSLANDEAHAVVAMGKSLPRSELGLNQVAAGDPEHNYMDWRELMPDLEQGWEIKAVGTEIMFYVIAIIVGFSVINTFMMLVFERTSEMGVLMAIGMRPGYLMLQLQIEALFVASTGLLLGAAISLALILPLAVVGMPFPIDAAQDMMPGYKIPEVMYPAFEIRSMYIAAVIMIIGTQVAAFVPGTRILRMQPVDAIRQAT